MARVGQKRWQGLCWSHGVVWAIASGLETSRAVLSAPDPALDCQSTSATSMCTQFSTHWACHWVVIGVYIFVEGRVVIWQKQ